MWTQGGNTIAIQKDYITLLEIEIRDGGIVSFLHHAYITLVNVDNRNSLPSTLAL